MAARRMVIVSDEQLLGRQTRDNGLGLLFEPANASSLRDRLREATLMPPEKIAEYIKAADRYAIICSRANYRKALLSSIPRRDASHA